MTDNEHYEYSTLTDTFTNLKEALEQQRELNQNIAAYKEKMQNIFSSCQETVISLTSETSKEFDTSTQKASSNIEWQQQLMLIVASAGLIIGLVFAVFIIVGLIRVLGKISAYAAAVANGDFQYDPRIREKGEIGTMAKALSQIPEIFNDVAWRCNAVANSITGGKFRSRLQEENFKGEFKLLAQAVNSVAESYTHVLDGLPVSIMSSDKEQKIQFMNGMAQQIAGTESIGTFCGDRLGANVCSNGECYGKRVIATGEPMNGEITVGSGEKQKYMTISSAPLLNLQGEITGTLEIVSDITTIRKQQELMLNVAREASDISDQVAAASEELSLKVNEVYAGADTQRERIESTASAMTQMNATVLDVARNAGQAAEQSDGTRSKAAAGSELVNNVVAAINQVNDAAHSLQSQMQNLGAQAEGVGNILNVISDIADQTNLLALNAAIEAARAGDAGRGFAVVADSVRKLAENTMTATKEVDTKITAMQNSAKASITEVGAAVMSITNATELANSSGKALHEIVDLATSTSTVVTSIATAAEEQSATSEEITTSIDEIRRVVGDTSIGMQQAAAAIQQLSKMAQNLKTVMENLK